MTPTLPRVTQSLRRSVAARWALVPLRLVVGFGFAYHGYAKLERGPDMAVTRYHVTLPVAGSYTQIRQFIAHALKEVPAASLDDVQLRNDPDRQGRVEARLRFSLYFGGT